MRVTSNTYTDMVIGGSQSAQQRLATLQQQISTGNELQNPSDDPVAYAQATQTEDSLAQLNSYSQSVTQATTLTAQNNQAMTSLHQIVAQAGELVTSVTSNMSTSDLQDVGTEMTSLINQLTSLVNRSSNGNYLFGGSSNVAPLNASTDAYNTGANGDTTTIDVQQGNPVQVGIVAGRSGSPPVDGFLYDSSTGVDVVAALTQARDDLNSGNVTSLQSTDLPALDKALDHVSTYVGSTAAAMSAVSTASTSIQQQLVTQQDHMSSLTQTNLPNASVQLQQLEMQYQATLEAGTRIMNLSILNYIGSVSTS